MYYDELFDQNDMDHILHDFKKKMKNKNSYSLKRHNPETKKDKIVECYGTSSNPGALIVNPFTGERISGMIVGSYLENLFFKVKICESGSETVTLFYNSPNEYEKEHFAIVNDDIKSKWYETYNSAKKRYMKV